MRVTPRTRSLLRCAYCHGELGEVVDPCPGCGTRVHADCAVGRRCPTLGCRIVVATPRFDLPPPAPRPLGRHPWLVGTLLAGLAVVGVTAGAKSVRDRARFADDGSNRAAWEAAARARAPSNEEVVAACRGLLDVPANHGRTLEPREWPAAVRGLNPRLVTVHPRAVVIDLSLTNGLVVTREGCGVEPNLLGRAEDTLAPLGEGLLRFDRTVDCVRRF